MNQAVRPRPAGPLNVCLFGAAPDTANLGVSALYLSMLNSVVEYGPQAKITVFDNGKGRRRGEQRLGDRTVPLTLCGANMSRRYYRSDNLINMTVSGALGGLGNPCVAAMAKADAIFDISGGDSFTDLYGMKRFRSMTLTKRLALRLGVPLFLMPQTYGPFERDDTRATARTIVKGAAMAWARDTRNFETLTELLGGRTDKTRHGNGVDVAFALPRNRPTHLPARLQALVEGDRQRPLIGFNVSGLIYNPGIEGSRKFGFKADYQALVHGILRRFRDETDATLVLIPHVLQRPGHSEADTPACLAAAEMLDCPDRVVVVEEPYNATEMKWVIAQMDFFCGTRMHSTIAGLSSGVATAAVAYSKKTQGVFESCGQGDAVTDPRYESTEACIDAIWASWQSRDRAVASLKTHLPAIKERIADQNARIFGMLDALRGVSHPAG
ncbi:MAG: polysaccharide pyruvyl transferase family protein [Pseudomonadota bacterium]